MDNKYPGKLLGYCEYSVTNHNISQAQSSGRDNKWIVLHNLVSELCAANPWIVLVLAHTLLDGCTYTMYADETTTHRMTPCWTKNLAFHKRQNQDVEKD